MVLSDARAWQGFIYAMHDQEMYDVAVVSIHLVFNS